MSDEAGFTVKLARSNKSVFVKEGGSILFSLMEAGVMAPFSCGHGICGTCETTVLSGEPDPVSNTHLTLPTKRIV